MSYLYKKPTPKPIPATNEIAVNEIIVPEILEKVDIPEGEVLPNPYIGSHITEITYEEHLKNLEMMCKADRAFMKRVREFCEEHREENFPHVTESASESTREHGDESE